MSIVLQPINPGAPGFGLAQSHLEKHWTADSMSKDDFNLYSFPEGPMATLLT